MEVEEGQREVTMGIHHMIESEATEKELEMA
jgi:hypothetical protein